MVGERLRLSVGPGPGGRVVAVIFGVVAVGAGVVLATAGWMFDFIRDGWWGYQPETGCPDVSGIPRELLPPEVTSCGSQTLGPFAIAGIVVGAAVALLGVYAVLRMLRSAAWLEGTSLRMRRAFTSKVVDLSTATVTAGTITHSNTTEHGHTTVRRVPTLIARDPATGRTLRLPLQGGGLDQLPSAELRALADAITRNRPSSDVDTSRAAAQLREMADNPLRLPHR